MKRPLLTFVLVCGAAGGAAAAPGDRAKIKALDDQIDQVIAAVPTAVDDPAADDRALATMKALSQQVADGMADHTLQYGMNAEAYGRVQDKQRKVEELLGDVQRMKRCTLALQKLDAVAKVHGEASDDDLAEARGAVDALSEHKGAVPKQYQAIAAWHHTVLARLDEVPWPSGANLIELSRGGLASAPIVITSPALAPEKRWQTVAIVHVSTPIRKIEVATPATAEYHVRLWGPVHEDQGLVAGPNDDHGWDDVDEGTYLVQAETGRRTPAVALALTAPETPRDPMMKLGAIAADAPVEQHRLDAIYPYLGAPGPAYLRQQVFAAAPREAFVYPKDDLTVDDMYSSDQSEAGAVYPKKDEPLLVVGGNLTAIDAEGLSWSLRDWKMLAVKPSGAPALPEKIHPVELTFQFEDLHRPGGNFMGFEPGSNDAMVKQYIATVDKWTRCTDKVLASWGGATTNDFAVVTYQNGTPTKVEAMSEKAWQDADRKCGTKAYDKKLKAFDKKLSAAHNAARAKALAAIRAAWQP